MKNKSKNLLITWNFAIFLGMACMLSSCIIHKFTDPQPVDSENVYKFPSHFQGTYIAESDTLIVFETGFRSTRNEIRKILNGIAKKPLEGTFSIKFDSLKNSVDTIWNYVVRGNRVYELDGEHLKPGRKYTRVGDTLICDKEEIVINLGSVFFLRMISDNMYVLNVREDKEWDGDGQNSWWIIYIVEKTKDGRIIFRELNSQVKDMAFREHHRPGDHSDYYFDNQWTKQDMLKLIIGGDSVVMSPLVK